MKKNNLPLEKAYLIAAHFHNGSLQTRKQKRSFVEDSLDELCLLAQSAGAEIVGKRIQERENPDPAHLIGKGLVAEVATLVKNKNINLVIFDDELSPVQNRNLEKELDCKVIDRTSLILDIFASRARSLEGKLQVELAQMQYLYPRLVGRWMHFSRQEGGIGMRGPGETQLEVDRRIVKDRITKLSKKIEKLRIGRTLRREKRREGTLPIISIVGYTNAGKSTLLNALSGSNEYADDRLFATLDPVTRRVHIKDNLWVLVNDTVGFVQKLPHELIASFRSTFEEVVHSDLLIHVIDMHHPQSHLQEKEVAKVLNEMNANPIPVIKVFNKMDLQNGTYPSDSSSSIYVSAVKRIGIPKLKERLEIELEKLWPLVSLAIPLREGRLRSEVYQNGSVLNEKTVKEFVHLDVRLPKAMAIRMQDYFLASPGTPPNR